MSAIHLPTTRSNDRCAAIPDVQRLPSPDLEGVAVGVAGDAVVASAGSTMAGWIPWLSRERLATSADTWLSNSIAVPIGPRILTSTNDGGFERDGQEEPPTAAATPGNGTHG